MLNYYLVYDFVKRLSSPFNRWEAFRSGVIDKDGNILIQKRERNIQQKRSFSVYDNMIRNIKILVGRHAANARMLASFAAATYLIKEHNMFREGETMLMESEAASVDFDKVGQYVTEVVTSAMGIDSEGFMSKERQKKWTDENARNQGFVR